MYMLKYTLRLVIFTKMPCLYGSICKSAINPRGTTLIALHGNLLGDMAKISGTKQIWRCGPWQFSTRTVLNQVCYPHFYSKCGSVYLQHGNLTQSPIGYMKLKNKKNEQTETNWKTSSALEKNTLLLLPLLLLLFLFFPSFFLT